MILRLSNKTTLDTSVNHGAYWDEYKVSQAQQTITYSYYGNGTKPDISFPFGFYLLKCASNCDKWECINSPSDITMNSNKSGLNYFILKVDKQFWYSFQGIKTPYMKAMTIIENIKGFCFVWFNLIVNKRFM